MIESVTLAAPLSTGNATHPSTRLDANETVAFEFEITAVGGTPTVTFKYQGSLDGTNWYDIAYVTDATDTVAVATRVVTAIGTSVQFLSNPVARRYKFYRCVTTANTNVTYTARAYRISKP